MEVLQIRSNGQITLPASIRRKAKLKEGDLIEVMVESDGSIRLVPQVTVERSQAYFWTGRWQRGEREVDQDLAEGNYEDFSSMEDFVKSLGDDAEANE